MLEWEGIGEITSSRDTTPKDDLNHATLMVIPTFGMNAHLTPE
jgi:hypothetical protein